MPTGRISRAVNANEPLLTQKSGLTCITTRAPSTGRGTLASYTARAQVIRAETLATGSRSVRKTVPPRAVSSVICPSTQTVPSLPIHWATICSTDLIGSGASGDVFALKCPPRLARLAPAG